MVKKRQVVQSGVWQIFNVGIKTFSQFGYYAVMVRIMPNAKVELGIFALLNSFMNIGNILGDGGMGDALLQRKEHDKEHVNATFYSGLFISILLYLIIFIAAPYIADSYDEPSLVSSLRIFTTVFIFGAISSASLNLLQKNFRFKRIFYGDGLFLLLSNLLGIYLAWQGMNYMAFVWSNIFYFVIKMILFLYYEPIPLKAGLSKAHWKEMFSYGGGLTLIRVNNYVANFGIVLEVGKLVDKATLGIFDRTYRIMNIPQRFLYDTVQRVMMPAMVKKMGGKRAVYSVFEKTLSLMNSMMLPVTLFLVLFSKPVVLILLGRDWMDAVILMQIFFLNLPFRMGSSLGDTLMRAHGLIRVNLYRKIVNSIAALLFIYLGYLYNGLVGIGWGVFATSLLSYVQMILVIRKRIFPEEWKELLFKPFYTGFKLAVLWVLPTYIFYLLAKYFVIDEVITFVIVASVLFVGVAVAFLKKPALIGKDLAYIQGDIMDMFSMKKGKGKRKKPMLGDADTELPAAEEN